jgi:SAM-dependent methyltransferase
LYISRSMNSTTCPICKSEVVPKENIFPSSVEANKTYTYLHFPCCNFYKQEPFLSESEMSRLYENEYAVFNQKGVFKILMDRISRRRAKRFRQHIKNMDVLEIGSGTGEFLNYCRSFQPGSVLGVETSEYASRIAKEKYNVDIINSSIEGFSTVKKFDAIFMFHVIEHVQDPKNIISTLKILLKPNGVLIMETPNCESFEKKFYREYWAGWSVPFHTFIFSPKALTDISNDCGLQVKWVHYSFSSNTYSKLISYLAHHRPVVLMPFLFIQFFIGTFFASFLKRSGTITIEAINKL